MKGWPRWPLSESNPDWDAETGELDAAKLLWSDTESWRAPQASSAAVLGAIQRRLGLERPLGGAEREFLELSADATARDPERFREVWSDPRAYCWSRIAHDLLGACVDGTALAPATADYCEAVGTAGPLRALELHLQEFKAFALGLAQRSGLDRVFATPLRVRLPFAIPGTRFSLEGAGPVDVLGLVGGRLRVRAGGESLAIPLASGAGFASRVLALRECPVLRLRGHQLRVHPHAFQVPGWRLAEPALAAGLDYHERHLGLLQETLGRISRHVPELFEHFGRVIRMLALKPRDAGGYDDFSNPELPGSFIASVIENPLELADHFLHELQHNRLSCIEESGALFDESSGGAAGGSGYYSPWRDQPRSLYGVFHGVYVFVAVYRYWRRVHEAEDLGPEARGYVVDRLLRLPAQLRLAVGMLERHARLTPLGRSLLAQLARDVEAIRQEAREAGLPPDAPALEARSTGGYQPERSRIDGRPLGVREALREHVQRHAAGGQCEGLLEGPGPGVALR